MIFKLTPSLRGESQTLSMLIEAQYIALIVGSVSQLHCVMISPCTFGTNTFPQRCGGIHIRNRFRRFGPKVQNPIDAAANLALFGRSHPACRHDAHPATHSSSILREGGTAKMHGNGRCGIYGQPPLTTSVGLGNSTRDEGGGEDIKEQLEETSSLEQLLQEFKFRQFNPYPHIFIRKIQHVFSYSQDWQHGRLSDWLRCHGTVDVLSTVSFG